MAPSCSARHKGDHKTQRNCGSMPPSASNCSAAKVTEVRREVVLPKAEDNRRAMASLAETVTGLAMVNADRKRIVRETENVSPNHVRKVARRVAKKRKTRRSPNDRN